MKARRSIAGLAIVLWFGFSAPEAHPADIVIRVSVKFIADSDGTLPAGTWTSATAWQDAVDLANEGHARLGRGFRYQWQFDGVVLGAGQFFITGNQEDCLLETTARANPAQFHWRDDAMNAFVVGHTQDGNGELDCHGFATSPESFCGGSQSPGILVMCVNAMAGRGMVHEFGHFFGLAHTFAPGGDQVADTPVDANPNQCTPNDPATPGYDERCDVVAGFNVECCCATKTSLTQTLAQQQGWPADVLDLALNNIMSYHCPEAWVLTDGQLDRFSDIARRHCAALCTGVTYFVDRNASSFPPYTGYSDDPYRTVWDGINAASAAGGDSVVIRAGVYPEVITLNRRVTLRADRGWVVIGQ